MNTQLKPTDEQQHAIDLFSTGRSLKINAFAGSGKTATLTLLANASRHPGIYLAFNRSLADEAKSKFPSWITCKTIHQLAFHSTPAAYRKSNDKMCGTINGNRVGSIFGLRDFAVNGLRLSPRLRSALILETTRKYQQSDDTEILAKHVPMWGSLTTASEPDLAAIRQDTTYYAQNLWDRMTDPYDATVPLGHDGYLKLWALSNPVIPADYILLDEAQDTAPVMLGVLKRQKTQIILVGDRHQQIYEWRGAVNAMNQVDTVYETVLTQSFRFGKAIADAATLILSKLGEKQAIRGNPAIGSKLGCSKPDAILCRTNAEVVNYMIRALDHNIRTHIVGGNAEIVRLLTAVERLKAGEAVDLPEFFGFTDWSEVVEFSKSDEGAALRTLVRIVERYGERYLLSVLNKMNTSERDARLILSTVHKAKGRQWDKVYVNDDFAVQSQPPDGCEPADKPELRLVYVAVTRAQTEVQIPSAIASWIDLNQEMQPLVMV